MAGPDTGTAGTVTLAHCMGCHAAVVLTPAGACPNGHARSSLRDIRESSAKDAAAAVARYSRAARSREEAATHATKAPARAAAAGPVKPAPSGDGGRKMGQAPVIALAGSVCLMVLVAFSMFRFGDQPAGNPAETPASVEAAAPAQAPGLTYTGTAAPTQESVQVGDRTTSRAGVSAGNGAVSPERAAEMRTVPLPLPGPGGPPPAR